MSEPSTQLSIVVPCYNEAENIGALVERFRQSLSQLPPSELILVNNGSTDQTGEAIKVAIAGEPSHSVRMVTLPENHGYGFGILRGLEEARGAVLAWTHADLQTDPEDIVRAYECYLRRTSLQPKSLVKGLRRNRAFTEKILSLGMELLSSVTLGKWFSEVNAQPKLFPRTLYDAFEQPPTDFSLDLYLLYRAKELGYSIVSIPVDFAKRKHGTAKGGSGSGFRIKWRLIERTVRYIFALRSQLRG